MSSNRRFILFLFQFPITFLVGILVAFGYSVEFDEQPSVDWVVAIVLGIALDGVLTLLNRRDERRHRYVP